MGRVWEKLYKRLFHEMGLNIYHDFKRTRAGYWQRKMGAWSWYVEIIDRPGVYVGSQWSMTELVKAKKLTTTFEKDTGDIALWPND